MRISKSLAQSDTQSQVCKSIVKGGAVVTLMFSGMVTAHAACSVSGTAQTLDFPDTLTVSRNATPGEVLAERTLTVTGSCTTTSENTQAETGVFNSAANPAWGTAALENTVVDPASGIGLRLAFTTDRGVSWSTAGALNDASVQSATLTTASQPVPFTLNVRAEYVVADREKIKTGSLSAQTLSFSQREISGGMSAVQPLFSINLPAVNLIHQSCDIVTTDVMVDMGTINANQFKGVGSVTDGKPFNIELNCDGNDEIAIGFMGATTAGSNDILALNQGSTATGLGVQFLYNEAVVKFDNTPVRQLTPTIQGTFTIPFIARYIQTERMVKPGTAIATSNFDIIYL